MKVLKTYFDRIMCINYIEAYDRRENIKKQFADLDFENDIEFYNAIPIIKIKALQHALQPLVNIRNLYPYTAIGCALSHYSVIKESYELGYESVLVLEDDVIMLKNRQTYIDYLNEMPEDWDFIYFTPSTYRNMKSINTITTFLQSPTKWVNLKNEKIGNGYNKFNNDYSDLWVSAATYALNRKAMELYIQMFENKDIMENADHMEYFFHNLKESPLNAYSTNIRLFAQQQEMNNMILDNNCIKIINNELIPNCVNVNDDNFFNFDKINSIQGNI